MLGWVVTIIDRTAGQVRMLLMRSGNVESPPGPEQDDMLVNGLADLVGEAPAGMRDFLCE